MTNLRDRIRANCCPISGLGPAEMEKHVHGIEQVVTQAKARPGSAHTAKRARNRVSTKGR